MRWPRDVEVFGEDRRQVGGGECVEQQRGRGDDEHDPAEHVLRFGTSVPRRPRTKPIAMITKITVNPEITPDMVAQSKDLPGRSSLGVHISSRMSRESPGCAQPRSCPMADGRLTLRQLRHYRRVHRNVYVHPDVEVTPVLRARAAWLWSGFGCCSSAAAYLCLRPRCRLSTGRGWSGMPTWDGGNGAPAPFGRRSGLNVHNSARRSTTSDNNCALDQRQAPLPKNREGRLRCACYLLLT